MKVLCATDGSAHAQASLDALRKLPLPAKTAVTILTVFPDLGLPEASSDDAGATAQLRRSMQQDADKVLLQASGRLRGAPWRIDTETRQGHAAKEILGMAAELPADLLVMGSRGLGRLESYLLGGVSHRVIRHCSCSVLVGRPAADDSRPLKILLAFDGSEPAWAAVKSVAGLPAPAASQIVLLSVLTLVTAYRMDVLQKLSPLFQAQEEAAAASLQEAESLLKEAGWQVDSRLVEADDAADSIVTLAKETEADLILTGDRGLGAVEGFLLGSIASKVVHHAKCSVLIVKGEGFFV